MQSMEERRIEKIKRNWEDLSMDCLIKVFERVGLESLILDIPFVCKSWYKASLDPQWYKVLHFDFLPLTRSSWAFNLTNKYSRWEIFLFDKAVPSMQFTKIAIHRSCGLATELKFPKYDHHAITSLSWRSSANLEYYFSVEILEYVLERCPALKTLILPAFSINRLVTDANECLLKMICKLKNLEFLMTLNTKCLFNEIVHQIHIHCPNFQSLTAKIHHSYNFQSFIAGGNQIPSDTASAIVTSLPDIKHLVLKDSFLARASVLLILSGCRKLELLDVSNCRGFDADDAVIITLASHIKIFTAEGSRVYEERPSFVDYCYDSFDDDLFGFW